MTPVILPRFFTKASEYNRGMSGTMTPREFALWAHGDQRYGEHGYVFHLDMVAEIVDDHVGLDALLEPVAFLHDVVEDTPVTANEIARVYGTEVSTAVLYLTDPPLRTRRERKAALYEKMSILRLDLECHRAALVVKAADRLANVRFSAENGDRSKLVMYSLEHPEFYKAVYRDGLCPQLWNELDDHLDTSAWDQFETELERLGPRP
jgi:(p)ppGpp synthase/HD superfamily hydrolase